MSNIVELNYAQAHEFVEKNKNGGFYWDGYTIVKWSPGHNGFTQTNGLFRNGKWGYANRFTLTPKGTWKLPEKYVRTT